MHTAELRFRTSKRVDEPACTAVDELLCALERNGQLVPEMNRLWARGRSVLRCFVSLPEAKSLTSVRPNEYVRRAQKQVRHNGLPPPTIRVLGHEPASDPVCQCSRPAALVLATSFLTEELPLRCGDCAGVVPFYRFKHTSEWHTYEDVIFWMYHYRNFDAQWIYSGAGERLAYRQLSSVDSELSQEGRDVCRTIEKRTRVPVYYFLYRYYARSLAAEQKRPCPGCGRAWYLEERWLSYDFRCRRCRLVSRIASDLYK